VKERATALDVEKALRERFARPAWAFLAQVRNGTGWQRARPRTADAIAFSTWPSRGLELHGFEIKVDRGDVRRELSDPEKAEDFFRFCDRWWLAVADEKLVQDGELPPTWGLLILKAGKMVCKVEAPHLDAKPLDRIQVAAILRCVDEANVPAEEMDERVSKGIAEGLDRQKGYLGRELESLREKVVAFEKASGIKIAEPWQAGETIGEAVRLVLAHRHGDTHLALARLREEARNILVMLDAVACAAGVTKVNDSQRSVTNGAT
jgi:hypothetical protein